MFSTYTTFTTPEGIPCSAPNKIVSSSANFHISYNNYDSSIYGSDTTALVVTGKSSRFFILNGNHTNALNGASFADCLDYLHKNVSLINKMSDDLPASGESLQNVIDRPDPVMEWLRRKSKALG